MFPKAWGPTSWWSPEAVRRNHVLLMPLIFLSVSYPFPSFPQSWMSYPGCCWREMGFLSHDPQNWINWGSQALTHSSLLPPQEWLPTPDSLAPWSVALGGRALARASLFPLSTNSSFSFQRCVGISPQGGWISTNSFLPVCIWIGQCSSGFFSLTGASRGPQDYLGSTAFTQCLLLKAQVGKSPLRFLGVGCWVQ